SWEDRRLKWEPKDYGNLDRLSLTLFDVFRVWNPQFRLKGVGNSPRPLIQFHNTAYTLTNRGVVIASVSVSVFSTCRIDLSDYPHDTTTCSALLYSPLYHVNE
ncbi:nicotinic acetylcholine receptor subunit alpha 9, partial [Aphelenchoides avenae]